MKKTICSLLALCSTAVIAKTTLYGEVNAYTQAYINDKGTALQIYGYLSEFGFRNAVAMRESLDAFFDVAIGFSPTDFSNPWVNEGEVGVRGQYGEISLFYGQTPVGESNDMLQLMPKDPDSLNSLFSGDRARDSGVPVGIAYADGVMYHSPEISDKTHLAFAILPSEKVGGESGFSIAGTYDDQKTKVVIGAQFNTLTESDQLVRLIGQTRTGAVTLGGGLQVSGNSDLDSSARSFFAFGKMPLPVGLMETQAKLLTGFSRLKDTAGDKSSEVYLSFVNEQPWAEKVSTYGFTEWRMQNDLNDHTFTFGAGLRMTF